MLKLLNDKEKGGMSISCAMSVLFSTENGRLQTRAKRPCYTAITLFNWINKGEMFGLVVLFLSFLLDMEELKRNSREACVLGFDN